MAPALEIRGPRAPEALGFLAALVGLEFAAARVFPPGLWTVGALRLAETGMCFTYWMCRGWTLSDLGLAGPAARGGWTIGIGFSAGVGALVLLAELAGRVLWKASLLRSLAAGPPTREVVALFVVGGLAAPVFEEVVFRAILYGGMRKHMRALGATALVTILFAGAHAVSAPVPWTQAIGGILFCAAYEVSGSLWAPIIVHSAGNLAIFSLPLWLR